MKKYVSILLIALMLLSLFTGCGKSGTETAAPAKDETPANSDSNVMGDGGASAQVGTVVEEGTDVKYAESMTIIVDNTQMTVLDPAHSTAGGQGTLLNVNCVFNTLIANDNGTLVPELATEWTNDGNQHYTFKLRDDVYFHNGEQFTADDVAFTVEHAAAQSGGTAFSRYGYVDNVEVVNDFEVILHLKSPNSDFLQYLHNPNLAILNRDAVEADPEKGVWIGTGPYIVEDFVSDQYSQLYANENYWGGAPITKRLRFIKVAEEATRYMMLMNGEVDVSFGCNAADFASIKDDPNFELFTYVIVNVGFVTFNMQDPLMADINFRKAIACLINRQQAIDTRYGYAEKPPSGSFWGYSTTYRNMDLPLQEYDVEKAKEYLAQSKYNGETIEIATWMVGQGVAAQLQADLMQLGVNCEVFQTDTAGFAAYTKYGDSKAQIVSHGGSQNSYPSSMAGFYAEGSSTNKSNYADPEINELFAKAMSTMDETERETCYKEIQRISYEKCLYIPTTSTRHGVGAAKGVGGVILTEENSHDLSGIFRVIE